MANKMKTNCKKA